MTKKIVRITYQCEVCKREWDSEDVAHTCEAYPPPRLSTGDMIIWSGYRDEQYGHLQQYVIDHVKRVVEEQQRQLPGHHFQYALEKDHFVNEPYNAKSGYVNLIQGIGMTGLHKNQLHVALRSASSDIDELTNLLNRSGLSLNSLTAQLYLGAVGVGYSAPKSEIQAYTLKKSESDVLAFISRPLTDEEAFWFVCSHMMKYRSNPLLGAFEYNNYFRGWSSMVEFSLTDAIKFLSDLSRDEIVGAVKQYRDDVLSGKSRFLSGSTLKSLFPLDERKASGRWPKFATKWAKKNEITGSGSTRLGRVYRHLTERMAGAGVAIKMNNQLRLWDKKTVIYVAAHKGGVGKSTVASALARACANQGLSTMLFDFDVAGPSVPALFPVDDPRYRVENKKIIPHIVDGVKTISTGHLLEEGEALTWRGSYIPVFLHMLATHVQDDNVELVIVDMPPGTGDVQRAIREMCPHSYGLIVTTAGEVALSDTQRLIGNLGSDQLARTLGVVENMAYLPQHPTICPWGDVEDVQNMAQNANLPFLGKLPMLKDASWRTSIIEPLLLPAVKKALRGEMYLDVKFQGDVYELAFLQKYENAPYIWTVSNLAQGIEESVKRRGGNPEDKKYHPEFERVLRRLWGKMGNKAKNKDYSGDKWWHAFAHEVADK